jgi:hypothetical protein
VIVNANARAGCENVEALKFCLPGCAGLVTFLLFFLLHFGFFEHSNILDQRANEGKVKGRIIFLPRTTKDSLTHHSYALASAAGVWNPPLATSSNNILQLMAFDPFQIPTEVGRRCRES